MATADIGRIQATLSGAGTISGTMGIPTQVEVDKYEGAYEWTPTGETQVIPIRAKKATADIVINPIPHNYGLITWNGSTITVS